jgi:hypothetical protein
MTSTQTLPKNQALILDTMRQVDIWDAQVRAIDWPELPRTERFAREVIKIHQDIRLVVRPGVRIPSERQVDLALQQLVRKGLVEKIRVQGFGGGSTFYIRTAA